MRTILHVDFNSYFATVEQQANPRLRGKPIGVTGGDRLERTVLGAASVEAKKLGVKTGMTLPQAKAICPQLILVRGDSDKYLSTTQKFLNILKDYSPYLEIFSIDEAFLELPPAGPAGLPASHPSSSPSTSLGMRALDGAPRSPSPAFSYYFALTQEIKGRIRTKIGEWMSCSIGISYNKPMAKLAGSLYKPDGLVVIADEEAAMKILDNVELDEICGIGSRIKKRLNNMGVFNFSSLRQVPLKTLLISFKSYGNFLYNISRGIDFSPIIPFYERKEVKSIGHRHTIDHDTNSIREIKQILLKLSEVIARRLRTKKLVGKTISFWYRSALVSSYNPNLQLQFQTEIGFSGGGMQKTVAYTNDGLEIFKIALRIFLLVWHEEKVRMLGVSISNLKPTLPKTLSFLDETKKQKIIQVLDKINDQFGEFTLQRGALLQSGLVKRQANPFLADRRFKIRP